MTKQPTLQYGISNTAPKLLKYPKYTQSINSVKDIYSYVIKHYNNNGLSILIYRDKQQDNVGIIFGDWNGNSIDLSVDSKYIAIINKFFPETIQQIISCMNIINLKQAQLYFNIEQEPILVDAQISQNKFLSPGAIRDIFGKMLKTQEVIDIEVIDERAIYAIQQGTGKYTTDLIIKPSTPKIKEDNTPLYIEVIH